MECHHAALKPILQSSFQLLPRQTVRLFFYFVLFCSFDLVSIVASMLIIQIECSCGFMLLFSHLNDNVIPEIPSTDVFQNMPLLTEL